MPPEQASVETLKGFLGKDYVVEASMGHVRDLPSKGMGVDLETFQPDYEILASRGKVVTELKKLAKDAENVYLASDPDREGEAERRIANRCWVHFPRGSFRP